MKTTGILMMLTSLSLLGCSTTQYEQLSSRSLRNDQGHVVGHKEKLRNPSSGEESERTVLYVPRRDANGEVLGYEEAVAGGTLLRNVDGRAVGMRYADLRSRGSNAGNGGISLTFVPKN
jgi:hypothetical protein